MDYERDFEFTDADALALERSIERMKSRPGVSDPARTDPTLTVFHEPLDIPQRVWDEDHPEQGDGK